MITLRPAMLDDKLRIFKWRNDPFIYGKGNSGQPVEWTEHCDWFHKTLTNPEGKIFIIRKDHEDIGQVRYSPPSNNVATLSIYLVEKHSGKGYGAVAVCKCLDEIEKISPNLIVEAEMLPDNISSRNMFKKVGFTKYGERKMRYKFS